MAEVYAKSSFLDDFEMPEITHESLKSKLSKVGKSREINKVKSVASMPLDERIRHIVAEVDKILGRYKGFVRVIYDEDEFREYISRAIAVDYLALDTETDNSLDPLTCKAMGLCLYMPNTRPVYVPLNHCEIGTDTLLPNQVSEKFAREQLERLSGTKIVYHNGKFDIRVCHNALGVKLPIWWDTMIGAQLLNENELAKLKYQYKVHIDPTIGTYNIETLFTGLPYKWIPPETFALYSAIDAYDTYRLQQYQQSIFEEDGMEKLYALFRDIEVPVVSVTADMEDSGICMDLEFLSKLNNKYKNRVQRHLDNLNKMLEPYAQTVSYYQSTGKLDNPVNFDSPPQLNIVIYDILKTPVNEDFGRSTEKAALKALKTPFSKEILEYRHYNKLVTSFTEPLPGWLSSKDGKLHANFHQMGKEDNNVRTGRFSSTEPKLNWVPIW